MALKIKPSSDLINFIKSIPDTAGLPLNLTNSQLISTENVLLSNADVRWLGNYMQKVYIHPAVHSSTISNSSD